MAKIDQKVYHVPFPKKNIVIETAIVGIEHFSENEGGWWYSWENTGEPPTNPTFTEYSILWPMGHAVTLNEDFDRVFETLEEARRYIRLAKPKKKSHYRKHKKVRSRCFSLLKFIYGTHNDGKIDREVIEKAEKDLTYFLERIKIL